MTQTATKSKIVNLIPVCNHPEYGFAAVILLCADQKGHPLCRHTLKEDQDPIEGICLGVENLGQEASHELKRASHKYQHLEVPRIAEKQGSFYAVIIRYELAQKIRPMSGLRVHYLPIATALHEPGAPPQGIEIDNGIMAGILQAFMHLIAV